VQEAAEDIQRGWEPAVAFHSMGLEEAGFLEAAKACDNQSSNTTLWRVRG
jgi:hypothetical protein